MNTILSGNSLDILPTLPEHSVDLVFADPPYNLQLQNDLWRPNNTQVDAVDDAWDKFDDLHAYDEFTHAWLSAVRRVMKKTATIWVSGTYHNIFRVGVIMQDLGFWLLNTITWHKTNAMPNFRGTRLKNDIEFVIWAKYSEKSTYTFNHHLMKRFNKDKQLGSVWAIPACGGNERLRDVDGKKLHSTQKPEALLRRIILASSNPGDVVLDPFLGTGTTAAVAKQLHRNWIGIERDEVYIKAAQKRIKQMKRLPNNDPLLKVEANEARIPFTDLLKHGYLKAGQVLYLDTPEHSAEIMPDGKIRANGFTGSIHRVGAQLKDAPSCNGWMHWRYIDDQGNAHPLDRLRRELRQKVQE